MEAGNDTWSCEVDKVQQLQDEADSVSWTGDISSSGRANLILGEVVSGRHKTRYGFHNVRM